MADIEGGEDAGSARPVRAFASWLLGKKKENRASDGSQTYAMNPFTRFSAVPEERSHTIPHPASHESLTSGPSSGGGGASGDLSGSPKRSLGAASNLSRKAPMPGGTTWPSEASLNTRSDSAATVPEGSAASKRLGLHSAGSVATASTGSKTCQPPPAARALGDVVIGRPSTAFKVSEDAAKKYMHMAPEEELAEQLHVNKHLWGRGVIHPLDRRYRVWWYVTVIAAMMTGWLVPFQLAYMDAGYADVHDEGATKFEVVLICIFGLDMLISFFVGHFDRQGLLVMSHKPVALHYLRRRFVLDLITTLPFDAIVLTATCIEPQTETGRYIGLLGLLKLGRMYRVAVMYNNMSYNLNFGLLALTLIRNLTFSFFLLHWASCSFWFIAVQEGKHEMTWVGQEQQVLAGKSTVEMYIFSFYWAIVTFATLGYGDVTPSTTPEIVFTILYVGLNLVVWAYILGTITLLVTKQDEETGHYRARMTALNTYCTANNLSLDLKHTMAGLLRLHMSLSNEALSDEQVLAVYPTTIRRKILRQLYATPLQECYLFDKCGMKFLDALMLGARVELFLPKVEIVSSLDHVNELYIVMAGHVQIVPPTSFNATSNESSGAGDNKALSNAPSQKHANSPPGWGPEGDVLGNSGKQPYRVANMTAGSGGSGSGNKAFEMSRAGSGGGGGGAWVASAGVSHPAAVRQISGGSTGVLLPQHSGDAGRNGAGSSKLAAIPGIGRLWAWLKGSDSWATGHAQLQQERQELARVSRYAQSTALARASRALGAGAGVSADLEGVQMPASAMRRLDSRGTAPLPVGKISPTMGKISPMVGKISPMVGDAQGQLQVSPVGGAPQPPPDEPLNPILGPGDCFAEVAYFTEVPKAEAVRSLDVCRVLVIPRSTYNAVARDFPLSARQVLENLKNRAAEMVAQFLPPDLAYELLHHTGSAGGRDPFLMSSGVAVDSPGSAVGTARLAPPAVTTAPTAPQPPAAAPSPGTSGSPYPATAAAAAAAPGAAGNAGGVDSISNLVLRSSNSDSGAVPDLQQQQQQQQPVGRRTDRPLLSSMSVTLGSRYYHSSRRTSFDVGASPVAAAAGGAAGDGSRQARALTRFTSLPKQRMHTSSVGSADELQSTSAPGAATGESPAATSSTSAAALWEGGNSAAMASGGRGLGQQQSSKGLGGRGLGTMSLIPLQSNARVAMALEGIRQPIAEQQPPARLSPLPGGSSGGGSGPFSSSGGGDGGRDKAGNGGEDGDGGGSRHAKPSSEQQQQQLKLDPGRHFYSDEQLQAAAAAAAGLTLAQQRMLADLLRLRQLVNKAAAKFDQQRLTAFLDAAAAGEVEVVQDMLRQGMSPNTADYDGRTALMIAAYKGHKDVVLNLLFMGADTSLKDARGFDVMIEAARGAHGDVIEVLTRSGAKAGISRVLQAQLLCKATYEGKLDRLNHLLRAGCQPDAHDYDGQTALHVAAADGNLPAARVLVSFGGSVTLKDRWGYSPLFLAHKVGAAPLVEFFEGVVSQEEAAAAADSWQRERTEAALAAARYGDGPALAKLLQRGCPVDAADYDGRTLLHVAVTNKQEAVVNQLLAAGANPNAANSAGSSPLLEAAMNGSGAIQAALMASGARLNLPPTEEAALLSSVLHMRRHDQLLALLTAGANPAAADYDSRTPLHIAASVGDVEALQLLADAVADSSIERLTAVNWAATDRWGDTPLQEALRAGHQEAAAFLREMEQQQQQLLRSASASLPAAVAAAGAAAAAAAAGLPRTASATLPQRHQQRSWHGLQQHGHAQQGQQQHEVQGQQQQQRQQQQEQQEQQDGSSEQ